MNLSHSRSALLLVTGFLCLLLGSIAWFTPAQAHPQAQPPRPTLTPQPTRTPIPATVRPSHHSDTATPTATGRITGTVIDETTGAPAPNINVAVGDSIVLTDANGNYDRSGLQAGTYTVTLVLNADQGIASQSTVTVELADGETVVQHLGFRSPVAAQPTETPTPVAPTQLPNTGAEAHNAWLAIVLGIGLLALGVWTRRRDILHT